ncbi:hypothetical protein P9302_12545 [Brevibacillus agri]|uniref:hypothetical protein n=1 Tax=Brevibacillus agri TaxID=51101 RepID=UPI002E235B85|nr:hypothetical protein [Brevibacillus agri]
MIHFTYRMIDETRAEIETIFNIEPPQEVMVRCVTYDGNELPSPDNLPTGKGFKRFYIPSTNKFEFELIDIPLTPDEKIAQLEQQLKITQDALDALLLG